VKVVRHGIVPSLSLAAFCLPSCDGSADDPRPMAVVTAALEGEVCTLRWNGALVSRGALLQNSANLLIEVVDRQAEQQRREVERGVHREYDGPVPVDLRVEAARSVPYSCFAAALRLPEAAGFSEATLRLAGERLPDQRLFFDIEPPRPRPRFSAIVRIEGVGRMSWNGEAIDLNGLRVRVRAMDRQRPDDVAVAPADDVDFITFYEAVRLVGQVKEMPTLFGRASPSGTPGGSRPPS
jgi:hypothetical protein